MKKNTFSLCFTFLFLFLILSCQIPEPVKRSPEYISGRQLAYEFAKRDVMDMTCSHTKGRVLSAIVNKHLDAMGDDKSEDFKMGFRDGYRVFYQQNIDFYCSK